ncbi:hypothetical protein SCUCBS95973_009972 [Sporothrix curviconia]|uniref:Major facilitator superfamily (MFS) profile domain-containing protein n=1 Tax=Sporothrix curviconia TaxID=1260050 RepID=A0ABP0CZV9_9PEZI
MAHAFLNPMQLESEAAAAAPEAVEASEPAEMSCPSTLNKAETTTASVGVDTAETVQNTPVPDPAPISTEDEKSQEHGQAVVKCTSTGDAHTIRGDHEEPPPAGLQDQTNLLPMRQLFIVFFGLSSAMFCSMLNQTIVSTALPTMGAVFHDASISSWIGTAYMLTSTACQPLYGRFSDIFGRKLILIASLGIFLLGSIISGVSQNMAMLIVARAIAGIGGGGLITVTQIVVSDVVSLQERGKYQGIVGVVVAYISIPLTVVSMIIVTFGLPLKRVKADTEKKLKQIDGIGCLISFAASVLIIIPLSWGGVQYSWTSAVVLAPLLIGVALIGLFIYVELRVAKLPLYSCYRINLVAGYALWTIASGLFTTVTPSTSSGKLVAYQILTGLGSGQTLQTTLVAIQAAVKRHEMAVTTGARNFLRMMGSTIAIAACGTIINNIVRTKLEAEDFDAKTLSNILSDPTQIASMGLSSSQATEAIAAYARGVQVVYYMMTGLAGIQCVLCIFFVKEYSLKRADDEKQKAAAKSWLEQKKNRGSGRDLEANNTK